MKLLSIIGIFVFLTSSTFAASLTDDTTVKVIVGTQTYLCELNPQLSCKAVNELQQKEIQLKKNGGVVSLEDKARNLSAEINTTLTNSNVVYDITLCSGLSCSISSVSTTPAGNINQVMSGQYNITEKSFYILGVFINNQNKPVNLSEKLIQLRKL